MIRKAFIPSMLFFTAVVGLGFVGCSGLEELIAYTGGSLPPGEPDLGGIVVTQISDVTAAQLPPGPPTGTEAVVGARVRLLKDARVVGQTVSGEGGYFRFESPATGAYTVDVAGPVGAGFENARRTTTHTAGQQTFVTITMRRQAGPGPRLGNP